MRRFALALATSAALLAPLFGHADTLRVGMSGGYYPFTFTQRGKLEGFEVDLMRAIANKTGDQVSFVTSSFSGLAGMLDSGRIDTIANEITITPQRKAKYLFSTPYVHDGAQLAVRKDNNSIHGPADLNGKTVAVNLGSNYEQLLRQLPNADKINIRTYDSGIEQDVGLGRVDAFVMDRTSISRVIAKSPLPLKLAGKPFSHIENALPFRRDAEGKAWVTKVDKALAELAKDGTLKQLSEKWLGTDVTQAP